MLPITTETPKQLRKRLVAEYNTLADERARQGLTDLAAAYRSLAATVATMRLAQ
jgi:uncharacterized protein YutE (UPF0331/DUF86 family)